MIFKQKSILILVAIVEFLIILSGFLYLPFSEEVVLREERPAVMIVNIDGEVISTMFFGNFEKRQEYRNATAAVNIVRGLEFFSDYDNIKAFILEIDSFGGQSAGQEEIARYVKRMDKPVVAVVKNYALASGYFVAASSDKIYADRSSKIGDIGKTSAYVSRMRNGELQVCDISSSNYLNITSDDCNGFEWILFEKLRRYVGGTHELLVSRIAEMRGMSVSDLQSLSSDAVFDGEEALELGLIDEIGTTSDAVLWLEKELGTDLQILYLSDMVLQEQE